MSKPVGPLPPVVRQPIPGWVDDRLHAIEAKLDLIIRLLRSKH